MQRENGFNPEDQSEQLTSRDLEITKRLSEIDVRIKELEKQAESLAAKWAQEFTAEESAEVTKKNLKAKNEIAVLKVEMQALIEERERLGKE
ncbi:MAG: hypothetical protein JWO40_635 [Candidatus Doudnabacteria bacterium]|nr:hypothetical protein [Candidatus Doudnabacteria bacterium]